MTSLQCQVLERVIIYMDVYIYWKVSYYLMPRSSHDRRKHCSRGIVARKAGLTHARTIVHHQGLDVVVIELWKMKNYKYVSSYTFAGSLIVKILSTTLLQKERGIIAHPCHSRIQGIREFICGSDTHRGWYIFYLIKFDCFKNNFQLSQMQISTRS